LVLSIHRFRKNILFLEKNRSIVNFSTKPFEIIDAIPIPNHKCNGRYSLIASIAHSGDVCNGTYKMYIFRLFEEQWYEVQDLAVTEVLPQMVALSEAYLQVYECRKSSDSDLIQRFQRSASCSKKNNESN